MNRRLILVAAATALPLLLLGTLLWSRQGVMVWLQSAIIYCL